MSEPTRPPKEYLPYNVHAFRPLGISPVELPTEEVWEESQPFDLAWMWLLMGIQVIVIFIPLIVAGTPWWALLMASVLMALVLSLMAYTNLQIRMDDKGVHYRMRPFHIKEQHIAWKDIDMIEVQPYNPLREDGGYGMRVWRKRKAYNVGSKHCIDIVTKKGRQIILGTQDPGGVSAFLSRRPILV